MYGTYLSKFHFAKIIRIYETTMKICQISKIWQIYKCTKCFLREIIRILQFFSIFVF